MTNEGDQRRLSAVPKVHSETGAQRVGGRWLAATNDDRLHRFEDEQGRVSEVGERIMELVDGQRSVSQIVDVLCDEFEVGRAACEGDTLGFIEMLVQKRVLVW